MLHLSVLRFAGEVVITLRVVAQMVEFVFADRLAFDVGPVFGVNGVTTARVVGKRGALAVCFWVFQLTNKALAVQPVRSRQARQFGERREEVEEFDDASRGCT